MTSKRLIGLMVGVLGLAITLDAKALVIDSFDDLQSLSVGAPGDPVNPTGTNTDVLNPTPNALGDSREIMIEVTSNPSNNALQAAIDVGGSMLLSGNGGSGVLGTTWIRWFGGGPFDLTDGGTSDSFGLQIISNNIPADLSIEVTDTSNNTDSSGFTTAFQPSPAVVLIPFSNFSGVNFSSISEISLHHDLEFDVGTDIRLGFFESRILIPLPAAAWMALALLGGLGVNRTIKRRRAA